ncbi:MAG: hypothetical protein IJ729_06210 [Alloprevotella sp.]|nr:hypothetical protein [Alloprevotella sp.]
MKRFLLATLALFIVALASAQSYEELWKKVDAEIQKDLPKSALKALKNIQDKAMREKNDAQLLRAMLIGFQLHEDIAPDSGRVVVSQMEAAYAQEKRPVIRTLWQSALGQFYLAKSAPRYLYRYERIPIDTAARSRGTELLRASVADFELLGAARATDYLPLFVKGKDSKIYKNDLLSVLLPTALNKSGVFSRTEADSLRQQLVDYYHGQGNREATLLSELERIDEMRVPSAPLLQRQDYLQLLAVAQEYRDLPLNVETYIALKGLSGRQVGNEDIDSVRLSHARQGIRLYGSEKRSNELRNFIATMERPSLSFRSSSEVVYPGDEVELYVTGRNVEKAEVRIYRTTLTAKDLYDVTDDWLRKQAAPGSPYRTISRDFGKRAAHVAFKDTMRLAIKEPGLYVVEMKSDRAGSDVALLTVTRLRPMVLNIRGGHGNRVTPVDAKSGKPLRGGHLVQLKSDRSTKTYTQEAAYDADADGNILVDGEFSYNNMFWLTLGQDTACPLFDMSRSDSWQGEPHTSRNMNIYSDRAIYRPGQKIHYGVIAYSQRGDSVWAAGGQKFRVRLYNSNGKMEATEDLESDGMGTLGSDFELPEICLPGRFRLDVYWQNTGRTASHYFRVEEYKRPTFTAELLEPEIAYKLGDSIKVIGKVQTYTGVPVRNATVRYEIKGCRMYGEASKELDGETQTDEEGRFYIPLLLEDFDSINSESWYWRYNAYRYTLSADITAENGETQTAARALYANRTDSWLEVEWPDFMCRENLPAVRITKRASGNRAIPAEGRYEILRDKEAVAEGVFSSGTRFTPPALATIGSGTYRVRVTCGEMTDTLTTFTIISERDRRPFGTDELCHYERISADGSKAFVMAGTPMRDVTLFYDIITDEGIVESRRYTISDSLLHFQFDYRPEYGDGAQLVLAFARDGRIYRHSVSVIKPRPDKQLRLQWSTFRSLLRPGQQEEWRLRITHADGTPADASLMACLYDASLDQLAANPWYFTLGFSRNLPSASWNMPSTNSFGLSGAGELKRLDVPSYSFTEWDKDLFGFSDRYSGNFYLKSRVAESGAAVRMLAREAPMAKARPLEDDMAVADFAAAKQASATTELENADDAGGRAGDTASDVVETRKNFSETAFFHPALRTDSTGEVALVFTLPESLTSWNVRTLAHDRDVRYGRLDTVVIARKDFMVEGNLPRFVREGDAAVIPATLRNLTEEAESGTVRCQLLDAETEAVVGDWTQPFTLPANGEATASFPFTATETMPAVLLVRLTAKGRDFSDGEERYLPILPDRERVLRSVPFSMNKAGQAELRIDTLWAGAEAARDKRLVVELSSNPTWYAVAELPIIANYECHSATAWATRYYALALAKHIGEANPEIREAAAAPDSLHAWADLLKRNPDLKQTLLAETPWLAEADDETARVDALARHFNANYTAARMYTALDQLRDLQLPSGGWTWFKGMKESPWITAEVLVLLARQQAMTGNKQAAASLEAGFGWMEKEIARQVKEMKRMERKYKTSFSGSEMQLKYLYVRALLGKTADSDAKYLLKKFSAYKKSSMYIKALTATVQARFGMQEQAAVNCRSLLEHTVTGQAGMGRYFDTDRALWCWRSYRIPTQTAAIEALITAAPGQRDAVDEMRLWLIQAKRTQDWEMLRATTDAIYALLQSADGGTSVKRLAQREPFYYTLQRGGDILAVNAASQAESPTTVGYYRQDYDDEATLRADNIQLKKADDGLAWGAVYAQYTQRASSVRGGGNGLTVERALEVKRGGQWLPLTEGTVLRRGERLRQVFTLTADRDYDFVSLRASRAACMEPVEALSGYTWRDGLGYYRVVRDASNEYFFETFRKGTHRFTEECFLDRSGTYQLGTARLQSQYAPEFCGTTGGAVIRVE